MSSQYQKAYFLLSVADTKQLPKDQGIEVAFAGRSNSGKSSVLNRLTHNKNLARTSKTPGRTQMVNVFGLDEKRRIMDLPGYGFAQVPLAIKQQWQKTVNAYVSHRACLKGIVLVMDIRHPFKEGDIQLLDYCQHRALPVHILLNKADKLSRSQLAKTFNEAKQALTSYSNSVTFQIFSALKGQGVQELQVLLDHWYEY